VTATDKPRADLVALFDAFACLPPGHASLSLFGSEHESAFRVWAVCHGHRIDETPLYNATEGRWTSLAVTLTGGWITVHLDSVKEQPEAAEGSV
jgi:hypothetical protein